MAVDLQNSDQLLPPLLQSQLLTEENTNIKPMTKNYSSCFSSSDVGSIFSSPVESEQGSTESDSDQDDDYIAELSRKMAHYMLQDDENRYETEAWSSEWPELGMKGNIENLHKNSEKLEYKNTKRPTTPNLDFHSKQALIDEQIRSIQLSKLKQEQFMKKQQQIEPNKQFYENKARGLNGQKGSCSWVNLQRQQRSGSEMTAVFLGESGSKDRSCGTGVFLPRGITNPSDSRKKSGCSTVLIPARVVQALKLQFDRLGIEPRFNSSFLPKQNDGMRGDIIYGQQQFQKKSQTEAMKSQEIGLPQEWTY